MWINSDGEKIDNLIKKLHKLNLSKDAKEIYNKVILTNALPPKNGISKNKIEGDFKTPRGTFKFGTLYWRPDRVKKPFTKLYCKKIKKKIGWCNDSKSKFYNKEIKINKKIKYEKLYRSDYKYDYFILIKWLYTILLSCQV